MKVYDAHSHLHFSENSDALAEFTRNPRVIACDCSANIDDMSDLRDVLSIRKDILKAGFGIHPWFALSKKFPLEELSEFLPLADAIGEIGLDKKAEADFEIQREYFLKQLQISKDLNLPCVIHCRSAWGELFECLKSVELKKSFMIHAAKCSPEIVKILEMNGAVFSFGLRELGTIKGLSCLASVDLKNVLVESDGGANFDDLRKAMEIVAEVKNENFASVQSIIEENFLRFFEK